MSVTETVENGGFKDGRFYQDLRDEFYYLVPVSEMTVRIEIVKPGNEYLETKDKMIAILKNSGFTNIEVIDTSINE